ncbi:glycosyltransferase family 4 protein [Vibrio cortegadensis]|uniref:glycosyltransferase family 4 protein n=1 Tax=Vibrio cortegadensis TaxID=1328770 RepID=UPI00352C4F79
MRCKKTRVAIQQPSLAKYRIPLYEALSNFDDMEFELIYSTNDDSLPNEKPTSFRGEYLPMKRFRVGRRVLMWHSAQWSLVNDNDVVILSWDLQYLSLIPSLIKARMLGVKTILWGHGYSKNDSKIRKFLRDSVGRLANGLLFYDYHTADSFIKEGWNKHEIFVAPNSLDQKEIQYARALWLNSHDCLEQFTIDNSLTDKENIIYIGRVYSENRLDLLIHAIKHLKYQNRSVQLLIIGKENEHTDELKVLAKRLGVTNDIKWLGAIYDEKEIAPYMLSSSLCCYPSNVGLSVMHAMGYGVPVLTNDNIKSHNPEIYVIDDGINGIFYKENDAVDLANKINEFFISEKKHELGINGRRKMLSEYTMGNMANGFYKCIRGVLDENKSCD